MAIPQNLQKVELSGVYRDPSGNNPGDLWEWAQTFYINANVVTNGAVDPLKLQQLANWKMSLYQGGFPLFTPVAGGVFCTQRKAINVASQIEQVLVGDVELNPPGGVGCLPPAVCVFLYGQSGTLGRQTRKWIPGVRADLWLDEENYYDTGETALGVQFFNWATSLLSPANVGTVGAINDVVWDPANEVMRDVQRVFLEKYPRTKGSRQLTVPAEPVQVFP